MRAFVQLTDLGEAPVYIDAEYIVAVVSSYRQSLNLHVTEIRLRQGDVYVVKESPQEVGRLIANIYHPRPVYPAGFTPEGGAS